MSTDSQNTPGLSQVVMGPRNSRRHDLDALRAFAMLLGIVLHAALAFFANPFWMVQDKNQVEWLGPVFLGIHGFRMPVFFLISGFFTAMLWRRRGLGGVMRQRAMRIALPLAIGMVTIVPAMWAVVIWSEVHEPGGSKTAFVIGEDQDLRTAAYSGDVDAVRFFVERDDAANTPDEQFKTTPLGWAVLGGNPEVVEYLLSAGADPSLPYGGGGTAMHTAGFLGRADCAALLLDAGADVTIEDGRGDTPIVSMSVNEQITMMIVGFLKVEVEFEQISAGRDEIRVMLAERGVGGVEAAASEGGGFDVAAILIGLMTFPVFHHLWFLWHLCLLVVGFGVAVLVIDRVPVLKRFPRALVCTPLCLLWLVPLTLWMQWFMGERGAEPSFGPDLAVGVIPLPHVLGYYAIFFGFGAMVYSHQGAGEKLGRGWWLMLPLGLAIAPFSMALGHQTEWGVGLVEDEGTRRVVSAVSQVLYAWLMTFGLLGLFETVLSKGRPWVRYLSDSSYWLYLVHLPLIILGQELLSETDLPAEVKLAVLIVGTTVVLLVSYQVMVRHTPIGWLLNGRREKTPGPSARAEG